MDAWLTRLLAPKPATHGAITWWQGESAAANCAKHYITVRFTTP